jgi:hypothetical protein
MLVSKNMVALTIIKNFRELNAQSSSHVILT